MIKRSCYLLISFLFFASLIMLSACQKQEEEPIATPVPETVSGQVEEVSFAIWDIYDPQSAAAKSVCDYIEKNFRIKIKPITLTKENYKSELDWMVGANMLPDVFAHDVTGNKLQYKAMILAGQIQPIPKSLWAGTERLSAVMSWYEDVYSYKGQMYFVPRTYQTFDQTHGKTNVIMYRSDWARDLSKSTFDDGADFTDIAALLAAYRASDTDDNTIWDTWGITGSGGMEFIWDVFLTPFGVREWVYEDGKWIPGVISAQAKTAVSWAAQLFREGIIDPDIATQTPQQALGKFLTGQAGAVMTRAYYKDLADFEEQWDMHNPDIDITKSVKIIPSYKMPDGGIFNEVKTFESGTMISSSLGVSQLNKVVSLLDFLFSGEGRALLEYGSVPAQPEEAAVEGYLDESPEFSAFCTLASWNLDKYPESALEDSAFVGYATEMIEENVWPWSFNGELFTEGMITPEMCILDIDHIAQEKILKLIKTTRDFDADWDVYVNEIYEELNLEQATEEVNEYAKEYFEGK